MLRTPLALASAALWLGVTAAAHTQPTAPAPLPFTPHLIDTGLRGGYQSVIVDINKDGRPDVIAVATGLKEVAWYENPGRADAPWPKHVMVNGVSAPINAAAQDLDGDGIPEVALAHGFATVYDRSPGILSMLTHNGDPAGPWTVREIDQTPTAHRVRWAKVDGGTPILINAPLIGSKSVAPDYKDAVSIYYYRGPDWKRQSMTEAESGVIHGLWIAPWDKSTFDSVLSASFMGVFAHRLDGSRWTRTQVVPGAATAWPQSGSSDIALGRVGSTRYLAAIEPWHGNIVVIYRPAGAAWQRMVIDEAITDGHTLVTADLDGDGTDEVVVGERAGKKSVYLYRATAKDGSTWSKEALDNGDMAGAGCAVADLNADSKLDVVCIGTSTANMKWYENRSR